MGVKLGISEREDNALRVFENRLIMRIFRPKVDKVTRD
jgi:hypothetical protein